ncbi:MAG: 30S ribosome-binding factor RbfA [Muribaculaceae bacterium]|nr:30S ribosome-binding factor RbfA [Muribaculaceae bacterium]
MESTRQAKISRLLQKELSEIFRRETAKMGNIMVSVSSVKVSPDLSVAKAYLSVFPSENAPEVIENINRQAKTVRYELAQRTRFQLRRCPELQFYIDDSLDYLENIDRLLGEDKPSAGSASEN